MVFGGSFKKKKSGGGKDDDIPPPLGGDDEGDNKNDDPNNLQVLTAPSRSYEDGEGSYHSYESESVNEEEDGQELDLHEFEQEVGMEVEFGKEKQLEKSGQPQKDKDYNNMKRYVLLALCLLLLIGLVIGLAVGLRNKGNDHDIGDTLGTTNVEQGQSEQDQQEPPSYGDGLNFMVERCNLINDDDNDSNQSDPDQACLENPWQPETYGCCSTDCCSAAFKECVDTVVCEDPDDPNCPPGTECEELGNSCMEYIQSFDPYRWGELWNMGGQQPGDYTGNVVALSPDGGTVAVLSEQNYQVVSALDTIDEDYVFETTLLVRVYRYDCTSWNQLGGDILLDGNYHELDRLAQRKMVLSGDGNVLAIGIGLYDSSGDQDAIANIIEDTGRVYVVDYNEANNSWRSRPNIDGLQAGDQEGAAISLSRDGNTIAVSTFIASDTLGRVRILRYDGSQWKPIGIPLEGTEPGANFGYSVDLSADGKVLAVAAPWSDDEMGSVELYKLVVGKDGMETWNQTSTSSSLTPAGYKHAGISVSLSENGQILAVGILTSVEGGGAFELYRVDEADNLIPMGSTVTSSGWYGSSMSLSADGLTLAVGRWKKGSDEGFADIYKYSKTEEEWIGERIDWPEEEDIGGTSESHSVSLSADGKVLACGTPFLGLEGSTGRTWVYINDYSS